MDIDLNLNNYSTQDLENLFGLQYNYTILDVEQKKQQLSDKLLQMNVNTKMQNDIIIFLNNAKEKLVNKSDIIPKKTNSFIYSNPSDFFQGTFNPIEKRLITKTICIDTFFRSNYKFTKSTDYTYTFPESINNVVSMQIKSVEMPYTWYNISAAQRNNSFTITDTTTVTTISLPDGNYSIDNIIALISNQLSLLPDQTNISLIPYTYTVQISSDVDFSLNFTSAGPVSLGWLLGFRESNYTGSATYTSESTYLSKNNYFFIDVDDFHNNHLTDAVISIIRNQSTPSYIGNNIMARIPIPESASFNTLILNTLSDCILKKRDYFGPVKLEKMNLRILNRFGEVIDLNKNDYSIVFEVTQLYS